MFQKLSEIFSDENNYSLSRELLIKVRWQAGCGGRGQGRGRRQEMAGLQLLTESFWPTSSPVKTGQEEGDDFVLGQVAGIWWNSRPLVI